ncbi:MAG: hypothetical protein ACRC8A_16950 [Microcoleaceae cyanobacterium]
MNQLKINLNGHALLPPTQFEQHDKRLTLVYIEENPGASHREILAHLNNVRAVPLRLEQLKYFTSQLEQKGVLGLQIIRSPKKSQSDIFFWERIKLEIRWLKAGGKARGDHKYPWLCEGKKPIKYIGGGNQESAIAQARVELIEDWILQGLGKDEIIALVPRLQSSLKKVKKKPKD